MANDHSALSALVEKLDGLYAKATPGPWRYEEESDGQRMWGEVWATDDGENYQIVGPQFNPFSAELVAALVNNYPTIRAALRSGDEVFNDALEAAARICESVNNYDNPMTAGDCADAIRALKRSITTERNEQ